ncbi:MAG: hypothetical protein K0U40_04530 [Betaproteobacteria bacterium]|nr:hypothetical protein [Betaproteobacteria bacterium]
MQEALLLVLFVNNFANADDFELSVYFNLGTSEQHGIIRCRQGGTKLKTEYHLIVIKKNPKYTILRNLDLEANVIGDAEGDFYCDKGELTLRKSIKTTENFIHLHIFLVEVYLIKDSIFDIAKIKLSSARNYFAQSKFINEAGHTLVKTAHIEESVNPESVDPIIANSDLLYRIEIRRKAN